MCLEYFPALIVDTIKYNIVDMNFAVGVTLMTWGDLAISNTCNFVIRIISIEYGKDERSNVVYMYVSFNVRYLMVTKMPEDASLTC